MVFCLISYEDRNNFLDEEVTYMGICLILYGKADLLAFMYKCIQDEKAI